MPKQDEKRNAVLYARVRKSTKKCVREGQKLLKTESEAEAADKLIQIGYQKVAKDNGCRAR